MSTPSLVFDTIEENIAIEFDKALTKLEHCEFVCDTEICPEDDCEALTFRLKVYIRGSCIYRYLYVAEF